jgi:hypothetical protein
LLEFLVDLCLILISNRTIVDKNKQIKSNRYGENTYIFTTTLGEKSYLSNQYAWPSAQEMHLDESQHAAIKLAFSSKITLIQGSIKNSLIFFFYD